MNYEAWKFWLDALVVVAVVFNSAYTWLSNRHKANKSATARLEARMSDMTGRISVLEDRVRHAPTHDDLGKLYDRLNHINGELQNMSGGLGALTRQLELINEHLLNEVRK